MEGSLEKKTRHFPQRFHSRYFRLQKNVLNWYSSRQFTQPIGSLDLRDCISLKQKGLLIEIVTKRQRIVLKAKSDKIRNAWLDQLEGWNHDGEVQISGVPIPATTCEAICACLEYVTRMGKLSNHILSHQSNPGLIFLFQSHKRTWWTRIGILLFYAERPALPRGGARECFRHHLWASGEW